MNLEFYLVGAALILASAALFVWRSLPAWLLGVLVFALAMVGGAGVLGIHFREPQDMREACQWDCDARYGHRDELASKFSLCVGTCP